MKHQSNTTHSSSRRTPSFSSSSSSSLSSSSSSSNISYNPMSTTTTNNNSIDNYTPLSTPSSTPGRFSGGVPFSWEHFPGIPKRQLSKKNPNESPLSSSSTKVIPLVPPPTISLDQDYYTNINVRVKKSTSFSANINPSNNKHHHRNLESDDPFFAALVECSKDDRHDHIQDPTSNSRFWSIASAKVSRSLSDRFGFITIYSSCKRTCVVAESIRHLPRSTTRSYDLINNRSR